MWETITFAIHLLTGAYTTTVSFISHNWQFLVSCCIATIALAVSAKALRSSRRVEDEVANGDKPDVDATWIVVGNGTHCRLKATSYEVENVSLMLGKERRHLDRVIPGRSKVVEFPLLAKGTRWKLQFTDPAAGKRESRRGLVRYR